MLPALCGPTVLYLILFGFARLTDFCPVFIFAWFISVFTFPHSAWLYFVAMLCFVLLFSGAGLPASGGWGSLSQGFTSFLG